MQGGVEVFASIPTDWARLNLGCLRNRKNALSKFMQVAKT